MQFDISLIQRLFKPLTHQQGVWTNEWLLQFYPLYPFISTPFSTSSQYISIIPSNLDDPYQQPSSHHYTYQEITTRLYTLQVDLNNLPYHHTHHQQKIKTNSKRLNINLYSSSNSSTSKQTSRSDIGYRCKQTQYPL